MGEEKHEKFKLTWKGKDISVLGELFTILFIAVLLAWGIHKRWSTAYFGARIILFFLIGLFFYLVRPGAELHRIRMDQLEKKHKKICVFVLVVTCLAAVLPMSLNDRWNKHGFYYLFQYEDTTEAILNGHLYMDIDVSPELLAMENPYDARERSEQDVSFRWDHAFYNGRYYMYFGVVPVFVLFLPLRLLGIHLYSYQATQIFTVLIILGMFALFREICRKMCPEIPVAGFLSVAVATTWITIWYGVKYPALYCTADTGGVCMAVWGFYFCYKAFVTDEETKKTIFHAVLGALLSALTFGCRPTIGFFCLTLIPLLIYYMKKCNGFKAFLKTFLPFCIPFLVVGILLMVYNYVRFENPFEFGQSYQLTIVDQHAYSDNQFKLKDCVNSILFHFFSYEGVSETFPFIHQDGCLVMFPILFVGIWSFGLKNIKDRGESMVRGLVAMICLAIFIISCFHVMWAPVVFRRYTVDFYFLLGFLVMFGTCGLYWSSRDHAKVSFCLTMLASCVVVICFLLYFVPFDYSIEESKPELVDKVKGLLVFWKF